MDVVVATSSVRKAASELVALASYGRQLCLDVVDYQLDAIRISKRLTCLIILYDQWKDKVLLQEREVQRQQATYGDGCSGTEYCIEDRSKTGTKIGIW